MRYSKLFGKTRKFAPKDELTNNARLLVRAGFVDKLMAGSYSYLPLGLRVLNKIVEIVREEMNTIGGQEVFLPLMHPSENWKRTGGWDSIDILFKLRSRLQKEYALAQSNEEVITPLAKEYVRSYKDLPLALYVIQPKFRDELRAKSGILRGREFLMKDLYSWHRDQADFERYYAVVKQAYLRVYKRCGLTAKVTEGAGGSFSEKISYEFMVLTDAGEDDVLYCAQCEHCVNVEIAQVKTEKSCPKCHQGELGKARASEVGNVFDLGQKYTKVFDFALADEKGATFYPVMGCYGIGISRVMGVIVERFADAKGIVWPETVAPFAVHLVDLGDKGEGLYNRLRQAGIEVLWDDREGVSAGEKFSDADLIGIPVRLVVSEKTGDKVEWKKRSKDKLELVNIEVAISRLSSGLKT